MRTVFYNTIPYIAIGIFWYSKKLFSILVTTELSHSGFADFHPAPTTKQIKSEWRLDIWKLEINCNESMAISVLQ